MTAPIPPYQQPRPRRGRGLIITGSALLALSIVGGLVLGGVFASGIDFADFEREVSIDGSSDRLVPGTIPFRVPGDVDGGSMRVGVAVSSSSIPEPDCSISTAAGESVPTTMANTSDTLLDLSGRYAEYLVIGSVDLDPGDYEATCAAAGEPSSASGVSFTVGRMFGIDDVSGVFGSLFAAIGVVIIASLLFIIGLILLIVGLVQSSKGKQQSGPPPGGYGTANPYGQPGPHAQPAPYAQSAPYAQPQHGPPGSFPGQYGQPAPYNQPGPYAPPPAAAPPWPGPHAPGPPESQPGPHGPGPAQPPGDDGDAGWTVPPSKR